jgi:uncharacterized protein
MDPHRPTAAPPAPPDPPELPEGADPAPRWPAWHAPVGFVVAFALTLVLVVLIGGVAAAAGADLDEPPPAVTIAGTLAQALVLMGTAVFFASLTLRPRAWHFGLRRSRFWPALGWAVLGVIAFYVFVASYAAVFQPDAEQSVTEDLGAEDGPLALVLAGIVVVVVAPIAEEFFFRGFFYRALRTRFGVLAAAAIDGLLFGAIHYEFDSADGLLLVPPLAFLGFVFCLVYERTGSLYPVIAMHAFNNAVAYAVQADDAWPVSLTLGVGMLAASALVPRFVSTRRGAPAPALR